MPIAKPLFQDRREAGRALASKLQPLAVENPVILALPRGGVPIGFEVAKALGAPLDLVMVRKIGLPGHPELGIGAVVNGSAPQIVMNDELMARLRPDLDAIRRTIKKEEAEIERRRAIYLADHKPFSLEDRTVIVVDDGIATGATMKAALRAVRKQAPRSLILAVPLAPTDTIIDMVLECDRVVHLKAPHPFGAVGSHYRDFRPTEDEEVVALLKQARQLERQPTR